VLVLLQEPELVLLQEPELVLLQEPELVLLQGPVLVLPQGPVLVLPQGPVLGLARLGYRGLEGGWLARALWLVVLSFLVRFFLGGLFSLLRSGGHRRLFLWLDVRIRSAGVPR
jgi:hypothetical protein